MAVEAAIIMSAFLFLIIGLVEFAQLFWTWNNMTLALEEGLRYAMVYNPTSGPTLNSTNCPGVATPTLGACAVARANAVLAADPSPSITVSCAAGPSGSGCATTSTSTMKLEGTFTLNYGLFEPFTITNQATVPLD